MELEPKFAHIEFEQQREFDNLEEKQPISEHDVDKQLHDLRKHTKQLVFSILSVEIIFLMFLIICQSWHFWGFNLNNWFFGVFANACLIQTFFLTKFIVAHAFPNDHKSLDWQFKNKNLSFYQFKEK